jgi:hypothetical protein
MEQEVFLTKVLQSVFSDLPAHDVVSALKRAGCVEDLDQRILGLNSDKVVKVLIQHLYSGEGRIERGLAELNSQLQARYGIRRELIMVIERSTTKAYRYSPLTNSERGMAQISHWPLDVDRCIANLFAIRDQLKPRHKALPLRQRESIALYDSLSRLGVAATNWQSCEQAARNSLRGDYRLLLAAIRDELSRIADLIWICENSIECCARIDSWPSYAQ